MHRKSSAYFKLLANCLNAYYYICLIDQVPKLKVQQSRSSHRFITFPVKQWAYKAMKRIMLDLLGELIILL